MYQWEITWIDGSTLRVTRVESDPYNVMNAAFSSGVYNTYGIIKIERVPQV